MRYADVMSWAHRLTNSFEDYLNIERNSTVRHEFIDGEIYAMAGGTPEHGALAIRATRLVEQSLGSCLGLSSDVRIHIQFRGIVTYPDVSFVCGKVQKSTIDTDAIINPTLIIEVTSKTTESYDRTEKLLAYQTIPSLRAVIFVSHREHRVTVVERELVRSEMAESPSSRGGPQAVSNWETREYLAGQTAQVNSPVVKLNVDDLYSVLSQFA